MWPKVLRFIDAMARVRIVALAKLAITVHGRSPNWSHAVSQLTMLALHSAWQCMAQCMAVHGSACQLPATQIQLSWEHMRRS
jgi:hypothetical protein